MVDKGLKKRLEEPVHEDVSLLTDDDVYLFNEGSHFRLYEKLGAHPVRSEAGEGTYFAVWLRTQGACPL